MGSIRLGELPHTRQWREVVALFATTRADAPVVAQAIARGAEERLKLLPGNRSVAYLYWVLTRLTWHARGSAFIPDLQRDGIVVSPETDGLRFIAQLSHVAAREAKNRGEPSAFTEIAVRAFRDTVHAAVLDRSQTLFGTSTETVQDAFGQVSTKTEFGRLSRTFFGSIYAGVLQYIASKETSQHVGPGRRFASSSDAHAFEQQLRVYADESAKIVEAYSGEWYSKHNWLRDLTPSRTQLFVTHALTKLRNEVARELPPP